MHLCTRAPADENRFLVPSPRSSSSGRGAKAKANANVRSSLRFAATAKTKNRNSSGKMPEMRFRDSENRSSAKRIEPTFYRAIMIRREQDRAARGNRHTTAGGTASEPSERGQRGAERDTLGRVLAIRQSQTFSRRHQQEEEGRVHNSMAGALGRGQEQAVGSEQRGERRATCDAQRPVRLRGPHASKVTGEPTRRTRRNRTEVRLIYAEIQARARARATRARI